MTAKGSGLSVEIFYHFICGLCDKWWSIVDPPKRKRKWYCPYCGEHQTFRLTKPTTKDMARQYSS